MCGMFVYAYNVNISGAMADPSISIILPAHNETRIIYRTLDNLNRLIAGEKFEVIVVCNGCVDDTAAIIEQFDNVALIQTDVASKHMP